VALVVLNGSMVSVIGITNVAVGDVRKGVVSRLPQTVPSVVFER